MIYFIIILGTFSLDYLVKYYVEKKLPMKSNRPVWKNRIIIRRQHNKGMALERLSNNPEFVKKVSIGAMGIVVLTFLFTCFRKGYKIPKLGLACIIGGAASNLLDRIRNQYVVDYFIINTNILKKIVFNLADLFILIGSVLLIANDFIKKLFLVDK